MQWIALLSPAEALAGWRWRALQFTPKVAQLGEALLLEVSASERLFGGRRALLRNLLAPHEALPRVRGAQAASSLVALALLRLKLRGLPAPQPLPDALPLEVLDAAEAALPALARTGCRTWGALRALPRSGVARRFGAALLDALDTAYGERPESHAWLVLPEVFDAQLELPALATSAPELMWSAQRLLGQLQLWLQARQRGVLALEFEWKLDLRRLNGKTLPAHEQMQVRTAQPTQDTVHLRRLTAEQLARATLAAPASSLRLRSLDTQPWAGASRSFLPEDNLQGEKLHQLVERLSARLGDAQVVLPQARDDHRPERMQCWLPAREQVQALQRTLRCEQPTLTPALSRERERGQAPEPPTLPPTLSRGREGGQKRKLGTAPAAGSLSPAGDRVGVRGDSLYPTWLLPQPLPLEVHRDTPHFHGPLRLLTRAHRIETAWWDAHCAGLALRDYFIARSEEAGLVWIYCERPASLADGGTAQARWFLQGLYA
jgi:protein ImuB